MIKSPEKIKPFRLVKYFTFTSLVIMFLGAIVLSAFNIYWVRTILLKKSEDYALLLAENLNHQIWVQFIIPTTLQYGKIQLRNENQFKRMDKVVRSTLHSFKVDLVNIYDMNNVISYSFDNDIIGKKNIGGTGYQNAVAGKSTSNLVQRGNFMEILLGFPKESRLITYAPLRMEPLSIMSSPILGVVEIVQDLSEDDTKVIGFQLQVIQTCTVVMAILFLVLRLMVKRGERIIQKRTEERMILKEELNRTRHLSALGEMTAGISHEIRNPLGIIRSSAELLKKKMKKFDPSNSIPDIIVEESGRMDDIITDFLNYAKPKIPILSPCQISEVIDKNLSYLSYEITEKGFRIKRKYDPYLPEILADADMLYQAFLNILINAMQAMPDQGEILIKTSLNENMAIIIFEDQGEGVSDEIMEKVWDPFFTTKEKGTGLGLGLVKNIIESHKGTIEIENKQDIGIRVIIELPVVQEELSWKQSS